MYIDDALDSLELALNYNYGDATFQFSEFIMEGDLEMRYSTKMHIIYNAIYGEILYVNHAPDSL